MNEKSGISAQSSATPTPTDETRAFLDAVFDRALQLLEDGRPVEPWALSQEHPVRPTPPEILAAVTRVVDLARSVSGLEAGEGGVPDVPGYTVISILGRGGMGTVYLAKQESVEGRIVALKVLRLDPGLSGHERERFQSEIRSLAKFRHPHIIAVHDVVRTPSIFAYAMEFVEGTTLQGMIDATSLPPGELALRAEQTPFLAARDDPTYIEFVCRTGALVGRALQSMHEAGLIHRDVKPSNILLSRDGHPFLSDFGLVRADDAPGMTVAEQFLGTTAYAPPEQLAARHATIDARSDVYSLGATLYHALVGHPPFPRESPVQTLMAIGHDGIPSLRLSSPWISLDLETIVLHALDPVQDRRYQSAKDFADDLDRLLERRPIHARRPTPLYVASRFVSRHRFGVFVGAAAVAIALAGVVGLAFGLVKARRAEADARTQAAVRLENEYIACVRAAESALINLDRKTALRSLDSAPELLRGWEWSALRGRCDQSEATWHLGDPGIATIVTSTAQATLAARGARISHLHPEGMVGPGAPMPGPVLAITPSPDGQSLLIQSQGPSATIVDARTLETKDGRSPGGLQIACGVWPGGAPSPLIAGVDSANAPVLQGFQNANAQAGPRPISLSLLPHAIVPFDLSRQAFLIGENGTEILDLQNFTTKPNRNFAGIRECAVAPNGAIAIAADASSVWSFDPLTGEVRAKMGVVRPIALAFTGDSTVAVGVVADHLVAWDPRSGSVIASALGHDDTITSIATVPAAPSVLTGSLDGTVRRWTFRQPVHDETARRESPTTNAAQARNPQSAVITAQVDPSDRTRVSLMDAQGQILARSDDLGAAISAVTINPVGDRAFAAAHGFVHVLAVPRPESHSRVLRELLTLKAEGLAITTLRAGTNDEPLQAFDASLTQIAVWPEWRAAAGPSNLIAPPPEGTHLANDALSQDSMFGYAIAGDNTWLAVASHGDARGESRSVGSISVYRRETLDQPGIPHKLPAIRLSPADGREGDRIWRLAVGDGFVFAGSKFSGTAGPDRSGAVRVFRFTGSTWIEEPQILPPAATTDGQFGYAVAYCGGVLAVGEEGGLDAHHKPFGAVWLFTRQGDGWSQPVRLVHPDAPDSGNFGMSLALNVQGDYATIVVGDCNDNTGSGFKTGSAVIFDRKDALWSKGSVLRPVGLDRDGRYGEGVAVDSQRVLVGGPGCGGGRGEVEIFTRDQHGAWTLSGTLRPTTEMPGDAFGSCLFCQGEQVLVGARFAKVDGKTKGQVSVFRMADAHWTFQRLIQPGAQVTTDSEFGHSLWADHQIVCVGAPFHSGPGFHVGGVWLYDPQHAEQIPSTTGKPGPK